MILLIDSSGWIEFFADGPLAIQYSKYLKDLSKIVTPSIVIYEVYKKVKKERTEEDALLVVSLNESIALLAADISLKYAF